MRCSDSVDCQRFLRYALVVLLSQLVVACAQKPVGQLELMPPPDVYGDGLFNPLPKSNPFLDIPYDGILYATDRQPAGPDDDELFYRNERGQVLRLGYAEIQMGEGDLTWEQAREVSLLKARTEEFPVKIRDVTEWGIVTETIPFWADADLPEEAPMPPDAVDQFAAAINAQLANSASKDIYLYTHGYLVTFVNPLLVSAELWHFLGYRGAFIAYAWPSTPHRLAYIKDSDTAVGYARNLRLLIEGVAEKTNAEEIHIIGYSNGTRLVVQALEQLALINQGRTKEEIQQDLRIGNVILVGSDIDRAAFGNALADGLLNVCRHLSIYVSSEDKALGISRFLTNKRRLGELWTEGGDEIHPQARQALEKLRGQMSFINVTEAEGATSGNGHHYFRQSPWASSDILMTLYYGLTPEERGLVRQTDLPVYTFPPDYISRLWGNIQRLNLDSPGADYNP
ncbi:alpha/beta hydrolase [Marinobacter salinisoli]|uniref:Alpha/beta hydrolase n=1 Tax=Marinobacter salinisoli TaxID=2769486 RepID=A0ABX7MRF0_9GAMM|nr:alpha/beta hydrolase [Marinobacter salinisoli]QSP94930.1 alpha/beta hydrolase [Marinobacter salinisoli]